MDESHLGLYGHFEHTPSDSLVRKIHSSIVEGVHGEEADCRRDD